MPCRGRCATGAVLFAGVVALGVAGCGSSPDGTASSAPSDSGPSRLVESSVEKPSGEEPAGESSPDFTWDLGALPRVGTAEDVAGLLPDTNAVVGVMGSLTPSDPATLQSEGPLGVSDLNLVEPESCSPFVNGVLTPMAVADGDVARFASRSWASVETDPLYPEADIPRMTINAELRVFSSADAATAFFQELASLAEDCSFVLATSNWGGERYAQVARESDLDLDMLKDMEPFWWNQDSPGLAVDGGAQVMQMVEGGPSKGESSEGTTVVVAGDRAMITTVWLIGESPDIAGVYGDYLEFTRAFVASASGAGRNIPPFVGFDAIPELSSATRPVSPSDASSGSEAGAQIGSDGVYYEVTGSTASASLTFATGTGTSQMTVSLPWSQRIRDVAFGDFLYVSAQNEEDNGSVTCAIYVDGVSISRNTSSGAYAIASCEGLFE